LFLWQPVPDWRAHNARRHDIHAHRRQFNSHG
jgi:hypothetical protein